MACLKVLITSALFLAGSLGESWFGVLEALQNADYVLSAKGTQSAGGRRGSTFSVGGGTPGSRNVSGTQGANSGSHGQSPATRHPLLTDLDTDSVQNAIQRLFDASKILEDSAFKDFVNALCKLSGEMIGMQSDGNKGMLSPDGESGDEPNTPGSLSVVTTPTAHRRRVSGIHLPRTLVSVSAISL